MSSLADTGQTSTVTFATSPALGNARISISEVTQDIGEIDSSDLSTSGEATVIPEDLFNAGEFEVEVEWDVNVPTPAPGTLDTATITFPLEPGSSNGTRATLVGSGFFKARVTPMLKTNEKMVGKSGFRFNGITGPTFTAESA